MRDTVLGHALPYQADGAQPGAARGIELALGVGEEQDGVGRLADDAGDGSIGIRLGLGPGRGVEEAGEKRREVAVRRVSEDELLGLDRAGGEDVQVNAARLPGLSCGATSA